MMSMEKRKHAQTGTSTRRHAKERTIPAVTAAATAIAKVREREEKWPADHIQIMCAGERGEVNTWIKETRQTKNGEESRADR